MMTLAWRIESKCWLAAPQPTVAERPNCVGEWQMRAQLSILLLPSTARANFCVRKISSLVQRELETAPTDVLPYFFCTRRRPCAAYSIASGQLTLHHGSSIVVRISGVRTRSGLM